MRNQTRNKNILVEISIFCFTNIENFLRGIMASYQVGVLYPQRPRSTAASALAGGERPRSKVSSTHTEYEASSPKSH